MVLGPSGGIRLPNWPMPKLMNNHGNFIGSLGAVTRWLGAQRRGARGRDLSRLRGDRSALRRQGRGRGRRDRRHGGRARRQAEGELHPRHGAARQIRADRRGRARLADQAADREIRPRRGPRSAEIRHRPEGNLAGRRRRNSRPGKVQHTFGWPLGRGASGGSFLYHYDDRLVAVGFVVHLNYANPTLSPFDEFQRFKTHPLIRETFEGGKRLAYGARAISSGGWQSVPKLTFPGGALMGCAAGFVNFARIKGSHNAVLSGIQAAEAAHAAIAAGRAQRRTDRLRGGLARVRDRPRPQEGAQRQAAVEPSSASPSASRSAASTCGPTNCSAFRCSARSSTASRTATCLKPLAAVTPIVYPKPDGKITFDKASSVFLSNTNHEEDQPIHLRLTDPAVPIRDNLPALRRAGAALLPRRRLRGRLRRRGQARPIRGSSSTRRTASIAKPAT